MQFDPDQLNALSSILRRGSFEAAAAELSVTPSAISQRIKALEDRVGAVLIHRGTPCTATAAGARLAKHAGDVGLLEAQVSRDLGLADMGGLPALRIAVNADSLATWFLGALAELEGVLFDLVVDDEDHSADWLRRGEVSAAVTAQVKPVAGCDVISLGALRYRATAAPAFVARWFPEGVTPAALARAPCLSFSAKDSLQRRWVTDNIGPWPSPPQHTIPSTHAFVEAARSGLAWAMNPEFLAGAFLETGELTDLRPDAPLDIALSWQVSRIMAAPLAQVTAAVRRAAAKRLVQ